MAQLTPRPPQPWSGHGPPPRGRRRSGPTGGSARAPGAPSPPGHRHATWVTRSPVEMSISGCRSEYSPVARSRAHGRDVAGALEHVVGHLGPAGRSHLGRRAHRRAPGRPARRAPHHGGPGTAPRRRPDTGSFHRVLVGPVVERCRGRPPPRRVAARRSRWLPETISRGPWSAATSSSATHTPHIQPDGTSRSCTASAWSRCSEPVRRFSVGRDWDDARRAAPTVEHHRVRRQLGDRPVRAPRAGPTCPSACRRHARTVRPRLRRSSLLNGPGQPDSSRRVAYSAGPIHRSIIAGCACP